MATHKEITFRPPPATRFYINGSDVKLQFENGREREVYEHLVNWLELYVKPVMIQAETLELSDPNPEVTALRKRIEEEQKAKALAPTLPQRPMPAIPSAEPSPDMTRCKHIMSDGAQCLFPNGHMSEHFAPPSLNAQKHAVIADQMKSIVKAEPLPKPIQPVQVEPISNSGVNTPEPTPIAELTDGFRCQKRNEYSAQCNREMGHEGFCVAELNIKPDLLTDENATSSESKPDVTSG